MHAASWSLTLLDWFTKKQKTKRHTEVYLFVLAPPVGLEPTTPWLTVRCSTDWAKEEYGIRMDRYLYWPKDRDRKNWWRKHLRYREKSNAPCFCKEPLCLSTYVSVDLSSRAVSSQVLSALQSLTSVFGMGTGGPSALKTLTPVLPFGRIRRNQPCI